MSFWWVNWKNRCTGWDRSLVKWNMKRKRSPLKNSSVLRSIKWIFLAGMLGLFITGLAISPAVSARAGSDSDVQLHHPLLQQTEYPATSDPTYEPTYDPYPADNPTLTLTNTPTTTPATTGVQPSSTPGGPTATATITRTPTETATPAPNIFQTEDSEMGGSQVTPPAGETPSPTAVMTATQSLTPITSLTRNAPVNSAEKQNGFQVNWGMFWMGFALPVVAACGVVLYLLDRRPDLFRPKR
jgi:hypothetical protein